MKVQKVAWKQFKLICSAFSSSALILIRKIKFLLGKNASPIKISAFIYEVFL
jgi:hypothetical protein